ncbi:MAG: hypothetical protein HY722_15875 [Planctomycetes bacterium]|nr:hypothetical protein [Planctomycetota bacterium]
MVLSVLDAQASVPDPYRGIVLLAYGLVAAGLSAHVYLATRRTARVREDLELARRRLDGVEGSHPGEGGVEGQAPRD